MSRSTSDISQIILTQVPYKGNGQYPIILNAKWPIFDPKVETACGAATLKWRRNSLSDRIIIVEGISLATAYISERSRNSK